MKKTCENKQTTKKSGLRLFDTVKSMTIAAMFTALSVVIGIFCKSFLSFNGGMFRITFEGMPIILSGIIFGPAVGGITAVCSDIISYLLSPQVHAMNPIVTLGASLVGIVSGIAYRVMKRKKDRTNPDNKSVILSVISGHLVGSVIVKSIALYPIYETATFWRIPTYILICTVEATVICLLFKNKQFKKIVFNKH